jgi:Sec-independent protein translocase protein TatA
VGGLDPAKIFLILVIALIVVGPERLPGLARQLGGMWRELNRLRDKFEQEVRAAVPDKALPSDHRLLDRPGVRAGRHLGRQRGHER